MANSGSSGVRRLWKEALLDAFYSETASVTVMEIVAIGMDLWLAGEATMGDILFWTAFVFSLSLGLLAAYPVAPMYSI